MTPVVSETIDTIQEKSPASLEKVWIDDVVIGVFFTGVKLSTGHGGVAFTPIGDLPEAVCCPTTAARMPQAGDLDGKPVSEIIPYSLDPNVLKSAVGIATLNALTQWIIESRKEEGYRMIKDKDGFDLLEIQPNETVSLIGAFGPYIRRLKRTGNPFYIIEKTPQALKSDEMEYFRSESEMASSLKKSDVVIMTGTAIVNHTVDPIFPLMPQGHRTAVIGPTASMIPDAFFNRGLQIMAGVRILNPDSMIKILKQGGSAYHLLKECGEKIAFVKK